MFIKIDADKSVNVNQIVCASTVQHIGYFKNKLCINIELINGKSLLIKPDYITESVTKVLNLDV